MFRRIVLTSCLVALLGGLTITGLQLLVTVPIILEAETYEGGEHAHEGVPVADPAAGAIANETATDTGGAFSRLYQSVHSFQHAESDWAPEDGWQRTGSTLVANILVAMAFSLLLVAGFSLRPGLRWSEGLLWGIGGYATFFVLPALGLPPEIPGSFAADLVPRQGWWLMTVVFSGVGLVLIVFPRQWAWKIAGAALVLAPHLLGAPQPEVHGGTAPAALANAFVWGTAFVNGAFWLLLGGLGAWTFLKMASRTDRVGGTGSSTISP